MHFTIKHFFSVMLSYLVLIILIPFINISVAEATDPCSDYTPLDDDKRSAGYVRNTSEIGISICDNLLTEGWYRSVSKGGNQMPDACPIYLRCGSVGAIWMDLPEADKPAANTTITKQACLADLLDCCSKTYDIEVRNCYDEFYVYKLVPTTNCPEAYCFGTEAPCNTGEYSENGYTPGCGPYPSTDVTGTVVPGIRAGTVPEGRTNLLYDKVIFTCQFTPEATENYVYDIYWYINERVTPIAHFLKVPKENLASAVLLEEHWRDKHKMNMVVWCSSRVRHDENSSPSPHFWSSGFTAGIKFDKDAYSVKENQEISIKLELTVPLPCQKRSSLTPPSLTDEALQSLCILNVLTMVPVYQTDPTKTCTAAGTSVDPDGLVFNNQGCGVNFKSSTWNVNTFFNVTGKLDSLYNQENRITAIRLHTMYYPLNSVWEDIIVPDVKVVVIDTEHTVSGKMCRSTNDPHITAINGEYYDHFIPGEFILFKSTRFPYQVNAIFRHCNGRATCHCGIAVKNGDGLFVINMCPQQLGGWTSSTRINRYVEKRFCDNVHMTMSHQGSNYRVTLPTGTDISINVGSTYINSITIKPSVLDYDSTVGICGHFGSSNHGQYILLDKTYTTSRTDFNYHYAVKEEDSLFSINWEPAPSDMNSYLETYCVCRETTANYPVDSNYISCELKNPSENCVLSEEQKEVFYTECTSRRRRSVETSHVHHISKKSTRNKREATFEENAIEKFPIEEFNVSGYVEPVFNWINGWTEEKAQAHCQMAFDNSSAYGICSENVPVINVTSFITSCVMDIKIGGDTSYVAVTLDAYKTACSVEAKMMEVLQQTNSSTKGNGSSVLDELLETTCPDDCSGNGACQHGECQCQNGYFGTSCSHEENSMPSVDKQSMSGICNASARSCQKLLIYGTGFNPNGILCAFRTIKITANGTTVENSSVINNGQYMNEFCVQCIPPQSRKKRSTSSDIMASGYMISIANGDGSGGFTEEFLYIVYDPTCYECNTTSLECVEKSDCPLSTSPSTPTDPTTGQSIINDTESTEPSITWETTYPTTGQSIISDTESTEPSITGDTPSSLLNSTPNPPVSGIIFSTGPATTAGIDPCTTYTNLTGDVTRSVAWIWKSGDSPTCDNLITEQWYRIQSDAGNDIVSACPPTDRCGTNSPVWMNGSIPNFGDGIVERDVCVSDLFSCCALTWKIKLKHCGNFISYYLPRTSGCPQAYCFGTLLITTTTQTTDTTTTLSQAGQTTTLLAATSDAGSGNEGKGKTVKEDSGDLVIIAIAVSLTIVGLVAIILSICYLMKKKKTMGSRIDLQRENTSGSFQSLRPESAASANSIECHWNPAYEETFRAKAQSSAPPIVSLFPSVHVSEDINLIQKKGF